ncbi:stage II sporulation protein M [Neptuniibacter halophilus]|uniref:stage II sporulation protein M n=1 Tax=Neptuniibacter halophilus TaxID=651666 RepID=UPI0025740901|nr:stage II sporulation protein M [Neptuniibacter halophilus]
MKQQEFETLYTEQWLRFQETLDAFQNKRQPPPPEFPEQYRQICNHLSLARQRHYSEHTITRLNNLVMSGHHLLYQQDNRFRIHSVSNALNSFVATLRAQRKFVIFAALLFLLPTLLAGFSSYYSDSLIYSLISPEQVKEFEAMYDPSLNKIGRERGSDTDLAMFGHYINNNIGIAFRTFAGGIFFGLGSVFFLCYNGLFMGAIAGRLSSIGYGVTFYPFVIGHGALELTAIVFSGAAGLMLGYALINPGPYSRLQALKYSAREAVKIMYGAAFMLLIAAFIEAFWSSSTELPDTVKYAVGGALWLFVFWFCFFSPLGRHSGRESL